MYSIITQGVKNFSLLSAQTHACTRTHVHCMLKRQAMNQVGANIPRRTTTHYTLLISWRTITSHLTLHQPHPSRTSHSMPFWPLFNFFLRKSYFCFCSCFKLGHTSLVTVYVIPRVLPAYWFYSLAESTLAVWHLSAGEWSACVNWGLCSLCFKWGTRRKSWMCVMNFLTIYWAWFTTFNVCKAF